MDRMNRIRRGEKGEMVKRGRGKEQGSGVRDSSFHLPLYPFTLFPLSFHPAYPVHLV
jgi:hypothetical protein